MDVGKSGKPTKPSSASFRRVTTNEKLYENIGENTKHMDAEAKLRS